MASWENHTQVVISYRETDQTLVTTAQDYLANAKTKYRNWRLYGTATIVDLPIVLGRFLSPQGQSL